jgi:hypothetical protein
MQMYKIKLAAQACADASGQAYPTYSIPEPKSYALYREELAALNRLPQKATAWGADPDVKTPTPYGGLDLKRGGQPIDIEVCADQLKLMESDKKNLLVFDVEKIESEQQHFEPARTKPDRGR